MVLASFPAQDAFVRPSQSSPGSLTQRIPPHVTDSASYTPFHLDGPHRSTTGTPMPCQPTALMPSFSPLPCLFSIIVDTALGRRSRLRQIFVAGRAFMAVIGACFQRRSFEDSEGLPRPTRRERKVPGRGILDVGEPSGGEIFFASSPFSSGCLPLIVYFIHCYLPFSQLSIRRPLPSSSFFSFFSYLRPGMPVAEGPTGLPMCTVPMIQLPRRHQKLNTSFQHRSLCSRPLTRTLCEHFTLRDNYAAERDFELHLRCEGGLNV
ncbi:hypothetical protein FA13DRAFT_1090973 [Coprinellus micaceus]|uniref:Uncharacterized protein n=1 Tax=Coprinellus micaceus TaxID=71717 RepID=A0A4Y7TRY0_COPMI|nr:hypothetical protein FA13DRAFT_1090973 [Coprinellus micaceus]